MYKKVGSCEGSSVNEGQRAYKFLTLLALFWNGSYTAAGSCTEKDRARTDGYNKEITHFRKPVGLLSAVWSGEEEIWVFTEQSEIIGLFFSFSKAIQQTTVADRS